MTAARRRTIVKDILWLVATLGLVTVIARFGRGLGATTALNDATPWGFVNGFKVAEVAMAAGGFTIAAVVYIFHLEKYRPILRATILMAFLWYGTFIIGLLCDLGLPWNIWKPIIYWQPHSVLFEVAWCVMLYTSVLALEFSPTILEHPWFQQPVFHWLAKWLKRLTLPLVITGIVLSTLHQSSLGSLFLIMPFRLHPLWYSPLLPVLFFISAVAMGLMMVVMLEGFILPFLYDHPRRVDLLTGLGRAAGWTLWGYLALRLGDLALRGSLSLVLEGSWQSFLFLFEIGIGALLPALLLSLPALRTNRAGLATSAGLVITGMVLNRIATCGLAIYQAPGTAYFPTWLEFSMSAGIVAGAALVFLFLVENFNVLDGGEKYATAPARYARPAFDPTSRLHLGQGLWDRVAHRSFLLVPVIAIAVALLPAGVVTGQPQPQAPVRAAQGWSELLINGNRDINEVRFDHLDHQERLAETSPDGCKTCHHLDKPDDEGTACAECHRDMDRPVSIFDHTLHQQALGGNTGCDECHTGEHTAHTAQPCGECHEAMAPSSGETSFNPLAAGYEQAMHGACLACHEQEAETQARPELSRCPTCHQLQENETASEQRQARLP